MKFTRNPVRLISAFILLTLPFFYWNCSKFAEPDPAGGSGGVSAGSIGGIYYGGPGSSGVLMAPQDRPFSFQPQGDMGPFTISGLPTWASFSPASGQVMGVVRKMTDGGVFTVRGSQGSVFGPFSVQALGNPLKEYQWHLNNTGQTSFAATAGIAGEDIHMSNTVFAGYTGLGVRVAVSDTGVMLTHEAIAPNALPSDSRNYLNNFAATGTWLGDPTPDLNTESDAHGTAVSSLAAEKGWDGIGGRGVAPDAKVAGFLFIQAQTNLSNSGLLTSAIADQFTGNFDVFNYSWTEPQCAFTEFSQTIFDKQLADATSQRGGRGSVYLMAAGNNYVDDVSNCYSNMASATVFDNVNFSEMNTTPFVVNIAAVNANGVSSSYSTPGSALWISSTGGEFGWDQVQAGAAEVSMPALVAADFYGCNSGMKTEDKAHSQFDSGAGLNANCHWLSTMNGTSGATPVASGTVALLLQANPQLTWRDVKYILAKSADKIDPNSVPSTHPDPTLNLAGYPYDQGWVTNSAGFHFHNYYGFGRINVDNAILMAKSFTSPFGPLQQTNYVNDSGAITAAVPDNSAVGVTRTLAVASNLTIEAVQMKLSLDNCAGDIGMELTSPMGTKSYIMNINSRLVDGAIQNHTFLSNAFYGEKATGTWTLHVVDGHAGCTANLTNWKLNFWGY